MSDLVPNGTGGEILLYQRGDGESKIEVRLVGETFWLTINQMAELFGVDKSGISRHLKNIYETGELCQESVVAKFATTAADGKTYQTEHHNLDAIISVGYRVNSLRGTQFRIWATQRLREYLVKGFTMDDERLKRRGCGSYFDELLARIRDIRSSEKVFWRKVLTLNRTPMYMRDWISRLDDFLKMTGREILSHAGTVSHEEALAKAQAEYDKYRQKHLNDPSPVEKHFIEAVEEARRLGKEQSKPPEGGAE